VTGASGSDSGSVKITIGVLLVHGVGRHAAANLRSKFETALRSRGYEANVDALEWSQLWGPSFSVKQASALIRGLRNTAHLSILPRSHLAPSTLMDRVHRACYGLLDAYVLLIASTWLLFYVYGSNLGYWALGALAITLCLGVMGYLWSMV